MLPLPIGLKMATTCRDHHPKRVMVALLAGGGHIGLPQKYFERFRIGRVRGFRISSVCTNVYLCLGDFFLTYYSLYYIFDSS
jgi:hypothetical protein